MKIHVKYFASVRDLMEIESEDLNLETSLSVYELWKELTVKVKGPKDILVAVNHEYVDKDFKLNDGDEVAYFPPVTGG
jgi:molybdopterin synthase sulfur carrier subunit